MKYILIFVLLTASSAWAVPRTVTGWCRKSCVENYYVVTCKSSGLFGNRDPKDGLRDCAANNAMEICAAKGGSALSQATATSPSCATSRSYGGTFRECISYGSVNCDY